MRGGRPPRGRWGMRSGVWSGWVWGLQGRALCKCGAAGWRPGPVTQALKAGGAMPPRSRPAGEGGMKRGRGRRSGGEGAPPRPAPLCSVHGACMHGRGSRCDASLLASPAQRGGSGGAAQAGGARPRWHPQAARGWSVVLSPAAEKGTAQAREGGGRPRRAGLRAAPPATGGPQRAFAGAWWRRPPQGVCRGGRGPGPRVGRQPTWCCGARGHARTGPPGHCGAPPLRRRERVF
jgi:hypothetical protein